MANERHIQYGLTVICLLNSGLVYSRRCSLYVEVLRAHECIFTAVVCPSFFFFAACMCPMSRLPMPSGRPATYWSIDAGRLRGRGRGRGVGGRWKTPHGRAARAVAGDLVTRHRLRVWAVVARRHGRSQAHELVTHLCKLAFCSCCVVFGVCCFNGPSVVYDSCPAPWPLSPVARSPHSSESCCCETVCQCSQNTLWFHPCLNCLFYRFSVFFVFYCSGAGRPVRGKGGTAAPHDKNSPAMGRHPRVSGKERETSSFCSC